jgi:hypothetical protein
VKTYNLNLTIPQTNFAKGDVFGVKFSAYDDQNGGTYEICHDPLSRDIAASGAMPTVNATNNPTDINIQLPFKIDI